MDEVRGCTEIIAAVAATASVSLGPAASAEPPRLCPVLQTYLGGRALSKEASRSWICLWHLVPSSGPYQQGDIHCLALPHNQLLEERQN